MITSPYTRSLGSCWPMKVATRATGVRLVKGVVGAQAGQPRPRSHADTAGHGAVGTLVGVAMDDRARRAVEGAAFAMSRVPPVEPQSTRTTISKSLQVGRTTLSR
jgi:hypothetical protein